MSVLRHPFVSHCKTVWIPVQELCIKTRRDFLLDLTVETHSHTVLWFATALFWIVEVTVSWTIVLPASFSKTDKVWKPNICRNTTLFILFLLIDLMSLVQERLLRAAVAILAKE